MKKAILFTIFGLFTLQLSAQSDKSCINCGNSFGSETPFASANKSPINIYPNPTTDYIAINDESDRVNKVEFYNLTGRQMKSFRLPEGRNIILWICQTAFISFV
jgi:hypothetical protein